MGKWNYRVCKVTHNKGAEYESISYEIREAYYNEDGSIWGVTEEGKSVYSEEGKEGLKQVLDWMKLALDKEIIDLDTFEFAKPDFEKDAGIDVINIDDADFEQIFSQELAALEEDLDKDKKE